MSWLQLFVSWLILTPLTLTHKFSNILIVSRPTRKCGKYNHFVLQQYANDIVTSSQEFTYCKLLAEETFWLCRGRLCPSLPQRSRSHNEANCSTTSPARTRHKGICACRRKAFLINSATRDDFLYQNHTAINSLQLLETALQSKSIVMNTLRDWNGGKLISRAKHIKYIIVAPRKGRKNEIKREICIKLILREISNPNMVLCQITIQYWLDWLGLMYIFFILELITVSGSS